MKNLVKKLKGGAKSLTLIILIGVFLLSAVAMSVIGIVLKSKNKNEIVALDLYSGSTETALKNYYNANGANSVINIRDAGGYSIFVSYLNKDTEPDLDGAKVNLVANIETSAGPADSFKGIFDGQGHRITFTSGDIEIGAELWAGRMIHLLGYGGVIKNLELKDVSMTKKTEAIASTSYMGGIVGSCTGTIEGCIVRNIKFTSKRNKGYCEVGAIVGEINEYYGAVRNCMVLGNYAYSATKGKHINVNYFSGTGNASNSIFDALAYTHSDNEGTVTPPHTQDSGAFNGNVNFNGFSSAFNNMTSASRVGGTDVGENGYFYKFNSSSDNSSRGVYLRMFISWTTFNFSATTGGSVSPYSTLTVPSMYGTVSKQTTSVSNDTLKIYNNLIYASADSRYEFIGWTNSGYDYTANFQFKPIITIQYDSSFASHLDFYKIDASGNRSNLNATQSVELRYSTSVAVNISKYSNRDYNLSKVEVVITFGNGSTNKYVYEMKEKTSKAIYQYTYGGSSSGSSNTTDAITVDKTVSITLANKGYIPIFK